MIAREIILDKLKSVYEKHKTKTWNIGTNQFKALKRFEHFLNKHEIRWDENIELVVEKVQTNPERFILSISGHNVTPTIYKNRIVSKAAIRQYIDSFIAMNIIRRKINSNSYIKGENDSFDILQCISYSLATLDNKDANSQSRKFAFSFLMFYYYKKWGINDIKKLIRRTTRGKEGNALHYFWMEKAFSKTFKGIEKYDEKEISAIIENDLSDIYVSEEIREEEKSKDYSIDGIVKMLKIAKENENIKEIIKKLQIKLRGNFKNKIHKRCSREHVNFELKGNFKRQISTTSCEAAHIFGVKEIITKVKLELRKLNFSLYLVAKHLYKIGDPCNGFLCPIETHDGFDRGYFDIDETGKFEPIDNKDDALNNGWYEDMELIDYLKMEPKTKNYIQERKM